MYRIRKFIIVLISILLLATTGCAGIFSVEGNNTGKNSTTVEEINSDVESADFEIHMLDVGQGLSVLIKSGDNYMLYDGGGRYTSSYVVSYLKKHEINNLDYLIASHYDEDHIYGLVGVLNTTDVGLALTPDYTTDTEVYSSFRDMIEKKKVDEKHPRMGESYEFGDAKIDILGPESYGNVDDNDESVAVRVSYNDFSVIMTGDSGAEAEANIVDNNKNVDSTVYVVGHHGSSYSSSDYFLDNVKPEYAFISVGADNSYNHPADDTLKRLENAGCKIYRTDQSGEITAYSDGSSVWFKTEREKVDEENKEIESSSSSVDNQSTTYVINTNTMKFHYPDCNSVKDMAEHNKKYSEATREELIEQGYSPCGNCKP